MSDIIITMEEFKTSISQLESARVKASEMNVYNLKLEKSKGESCKKIEELGKSMKTAKAKIDILNKGISEFITLATDIFAASDVKIGNTIKK